MPIATALQSGIEAAWWTAPLVWAFARGATTAIPLEGLRVAIGRIHPVVAYLVQCAPCVAGELAIVPAILLGLEAQSWPTGVATWAGAWAGALLLDALHDRLRVPATFGTTPRDWKPTCRVCGGSLASLPASDLAVIVTNGNVVLAHVVCPK